MASSFILLPLPLFSILLLLLAATVTESKTYSKTIPFPGQNKPEKLTHLHFYLHDILSGDNTTAVNVIKSPLTNSTFGSTSVADEILTEGPDLRSKEIGRAQALYTLADLNNPASFVMAFNFVFTDGEFNGSTFALFGLFSVPTKVREIAIIGGTGDFRFARGYAQIKTYKFTPVVTVAEYNVHIWH